MVASVDQIVGGNGGGPPEATGLPSREGFILRQCVALQADDGTANSETFEYFLACPAGAVRVASKTSSARWPTRIHSLINCVCVADQVSPFAADLASLGTSLPDAADQAALVTAASGAWAEAQALQ